VGIGFSLIGRKIGEEIKKFIQIIFEARKDDNRNALLYNSAGDDSVPVNDERIILVKVDGNGKYIAVGVLIPSQGAKPGEKILDLFNNHLNQPVVVYDTTNQSHSQSMSVAAMSPVRICHTSECFYLAIDMFNDNTPACKHLVICFFFFGQLMVFT
jgi:hypothetical protein